MITCSAGLIPSTEKIGILIFPFAITFIAGLSSMYDHETKIPMGLGILITIFSGLGTAVVLMYAIMYL